MAEAVTTLASWAEEDVRLATVLGALDELRRPEPMPATRTSVLTMVVVASAEREADRAVVALRELGGRHPARVVALLARPGTREPRIDASVVLLGAASGDRPVWFEEVHLDVSGPVTDHLDSLIEPFTIADLPVVAWFVHDLPAPSDPLLAAADVVLVDARDFGESECFSTLLSLRGRPVVDLSWHRLRPWRALLASLFDPPRVRPFLRGIRSVTVEGKTGPRHLLAGWISSRLGVPSTEVHLREGEHVTMEVVAEVDGTRARFVVARAGDERIVVARAAVDGEPAVELAVPLPDPTPAWGLASALSNLERDHVFEESLVAAVALAAREARAAGPVESPG
ncbi:MAG TPA: glucose-6-phosphate dehydrogenase assembly protein OpcA [Acidimicrobiales bacterium]|nr:glucose-6-phosphate dehydrogenase assembly protein OpcA [Acidimicrobiales bacterium]